MAKVPVKVRYYDNFFKYPIIICAVLAVSLGASYVMRYTSYMTKIESPIETIASSDDEKNRLIDEYLNENPDVKAEVDEMNTMKYAAIVFGITFVVAKVLNYTYQVNRDNKIYDDENEREKKRVISEFNIEQKNLELKKVVIDIVGIDYYEAYIDQQYESLSSNHDKFNYLCGLLKYIHNELKELEN